MWHVIKADAFSLANLIDFGCINTADPDAATCDVYSIPVIYLGSTLCGAFSYHRRKQNKKYN